MRRKKIIYKSFVNLNLKDIDFMSSEDLDDKNQCTNTVEVLL